jgi:hypothetical protein
MDGTELLQQRIQLLEKEVTLLNKSMGMEFERISRAFAQFGSLLDLVFLEVSVLLDYLKSKNLIDEKEFSELLEKTGKQVEEQIKNAAEKQEETKSETKIEKL